MLPLPSLEFGNFADGVPPCIAWSPDFPKFTLIVGEIEQESLCAAFSETDNWLAPLRTLDVCVLYTDDFEVQVDERAVVRFENLAPDQKLGCLVASGKELRLCAPPYLSGRGYIMLPIRLSGLHLPPGYMLAFPSWKIVKRLGDVEHVLFQRC